MSEENGVVGDGKWVKRIVRNADSVWRVERQSQIPGYSAPAASSERARWNGVTVETFSFDRPLPDFTVSFSDLTVGALHTGSKTLWVEHPRNVRSMGPGAVAILPAAMVVGVGTPEPAAWTSVHLKPSLLSTAAEDCVNPDRIEIIPDVVFREPQIQRMVLAFEAEARGGFLSGRLFGESLGIALSAYLLSHNAAGAGTSHQHQGGMTRYQLRRTLDYIHANLGRDLGVAELAGEARMSHWHFCRMFKRSTGMAPHQYLIRERIEAAKIALARPGAPLAVIARELGFSDQSHFTMVFRRFTGMTPRHYRRSL